MAVSSHDHEVSIESHMKFLANYKEYLKSYIVQYTTERLNLYDTELNTG